jgi:hypothetical protein
MNTDALYTISFLFRKPIVVRAHSIEVKGRQFGFDSLGIIRIHVVTLRRLIMPSLRVKIELCDRNKAVVESLSTEGINRAEARHLATTLKQIATTSYPELKINLRDQ